MPGDTKAPFFSIILPVYNGKRYLRQTLDSVLSQTFTGWELILIDDVSTDDTPFIIQEYLLKDSRIHSIRNEKNINCGPSANRGIEIAKGEWITRIDADDLYFPEYLEDLYQLIGDNKGKVFFASAAVRIIDAEGQSIVNMHLPPPKKIKRMLNAENYMYHPATSYPRELWKKVGGYPAVQPDIRDGGDDRALWNKFFKAGASLVLLQKISVAYRVHFSNMSYTAGYGNREWIISLYLKSGMLSKAREEILESGSLKGPKKFKNYFYFFLTYLPAGVVRTLMWEIRPWIRWVARRLKNFR